ADLPTGDDADVVVAAGVPEEAGMEAVKETAPLPLIAFDGIQGLDVGERDVWVALPFAADPTHGIEAARAAQIVVDALAGGATTLAGRDEGTGLWPLHPNDVEPGNEQPSRGLYCGAAGIIWALDQLGVAHGFTVEPEPGGDDGFLDGRAGVLAVTGGAGLR